MTPEALLALFETCAAAQRGALRSLDVDARRGTTDRPGQYALDLVADAAVLPLLHAAGVRVLSEESAWTGPEDAAYTVVLDPVDGSTNCSRGIPYWAISLCALDAEGPVCSLVVNSATGQRNHAIRGSGAWCDDVTVRTAPTERLAEAVVAIAGDPPVALRWQQFRALGSAALALCDVAAGRIDAYVDLVVHNSPWDYLGGLLMCQEAGATVVDVGGRELLDVDVDSRRQLVATSTASLRREIVAALP